MTPKFYKPPVDSTGKQLWVPLVIKNRDALIGFILGVNLTDSIYGIDRDAIFATLSSARFNDITKSGKRLRHMSNREFEEYAKSLLQDSQDRIDTHATKDDDNCDLDDFVLTLSCSCGNFIGYTSIEKLPTKDAHCDICGNKIINYTKTDDVFIYDGLTGRNNEAIFSIINSMVEAEPVEESEDPEDLAW